MKVSICIDDNHGMLFNKRRQSKDKAVLADLMRDEKKIYIHSFSEKMFEEYSGQVVVDDDFLNKAVEGEMCFVENRTLTIYEGKIEELIIYKWNRKYPADFRLDLDLSNWEQKETWEFVGNSHEKITKETYIRKN